jgi:hypothetical protein
MRQLGRDFALAAVLCAAGLLTAYRTGGGWRPPAGRPGPVPAASSHPDAPPGCSRVRLLFAGAGEERRFSGRIVAMAPGATLTLADRVELPPEAASVAGPIATLDLATRARVPVGLVLDVSPPGAAIGWELRLEHELVGPDLLFAGPFGLGAPELSYGLMSPELQARARAAVPPTVDAVHELGVFVSCDCGP